MSVPVGVGGLLAALLVASVVLGAGETMRAGPLADAGDGMAVQRGRDVYRGHCASCHGRSLQGQALWQVVDRYAGRRAPALDRTGRSWKRSDAELVLLIRNGERAAIGPGMPPFAALLPDRDVLAVTAYIKAQWPIGLRVLQAIRNPGGAAMPAGAGHSEWTFPPDCPF